VLTSNLGSQFSRRWAMGRGCREGRAAGDGDRPRHFRPEFLNRLDEIILFHRLGAEHMAPIVDIQVGRVRSCSRTAR
jgi:ATP-dependent Clp protease ATP-binding subunit ClpB